ncbi:MAG: 50S ribosomal protein L4 [Candidatus Omnitrophica bacterium]|nr:50S ribosomal protein L4 [Candidatus Omnitrophota bacterium]
METISLPIYNCEGKEVDTLKLPAAVFDGTVNKDAIYQAVVAYRANQRKGLASTKTRGEVSGGGRKPWRQKGTGRARVGSTRNPLWRHGGVVFGPHPRSFYTNLPQKIRSLALKSSLNAKVKENNLLIVDKFAPEGAKTKEAAKIFSNLKVANTKAGRNAALLLTEKLSRDLKLATRNIGFLNVNLVRDTHAYEILTHRKVIITKTGLEELVSRLKK